jgi:hypothetical protein
MATAAQITSALANARHSTGPRTAAGKAASSRNALKLGIYSAAAVLPGEDSAEYQQLTRDYEDHFRPVGPDETQLVHDIAHATWLTRRYDRIECEFYHIRHAALSPDDLRYPLGAIYIKDSEGPNVLAKIERQRNAARRKFWAARKELERLQQNRLYAQCAPADPEPDPLTDCSINDIPRIPVRFDNFPDTLDSRPWAGGPTPLHTPKDNWDNPALRL